MPKMLTTSRSLLLAGALAFAALPALAQTSPQTQPATPSTGTSTTTPGASTDMGTTGKTTTGLVQAILATAKTYLANAVTSGDITQAQSDAILAGLTRTVTADVNRSTSPRPFGRHGHGPGGTARPAHRR